MRSLPGGVSSRAGFPFLAGAIVLIFAVSTVRLLSVGAADARMLLVFWTDESMHVNLIAHALASRTPWLDFVGYGHFFFNLALIAARLAWWTRPPTEHDVALILRGVAWVSALACLGLTGTLSRHVLSAKWSLVMLLLATTPVFIRMSVMSHPDMLELACVLACLNAMVLRLEDRGWYTVLAAAACAGLAVAAKLGMFILLPVVWAVDAPWRRTMLPRPWAVAAIRVSLVLAALLAGLAAYGLTPTFIARHLASDGRIDDSVVLSLLPTLRLLGAAAGVLCLATAVPPVWSQLVVRPRIIQTLLTVLATTLAAVAAFTIVSPASWWRLSIVKAVLYEHLAAGHGDADAWQWFSIVAGPDVMGPVLAPAALAAIAGLAAGMDRPRRAGLVLLASWAVLFGAVLLLAVRSRPSHYVLPVLPVLIILAVVACRYAADRVRASGSRLLAVAGLVVCALVVAGQALRAQSERHALRYRVEGSRTMRIGNLLPAWIPDDSVILFDYPTYVPARFINAKPTWGGSLRLLDAAHPDVVLVNSTFEHMYRRDPTLDAMDDPSVYYDALARGDTAYRLFKRVDDVTMYRRPSGVLHAPSDR